MINAGLYVHLVEIDKVSAFISLFGGNKLHVAVLTDISKKQKPKIERLRESRLLKEGHVFTVANFCEKSEADIEDLLSPNLFIDIVNQAYHLADGHALNLEKLENANQNTERQGLKGRVVFQPSPR